MTYLFIMCVPDTEIVSIPKAVKNKICYLHFCVSESILWPDLKFCSMVMVG